MENILGYIFLGAICLVCLIYIIYKIVKFCKMTPDEKKEVLVIYLKGLVAFAEQSIGAGHGAEKLALVEEYFMTKAPTFYKLLLFAIGADNLTELIEIALKEVKLSFMK